MDQPPDDRALPARAPSPAALPAARPVRGARRWLGTVVAFAALIALAALAWWLTHRAPEAPVGAGGRGIGRRPRRRGGSGALAAPAARRALAAAAARRRARSALRPATRADLPIVLDALGTGHRRRQRHRAAAGLGTDHAGALQRRADRQEGTAASSRSIRARSRRRCSRRSARA
jgi:hypothetical protein